MSYPRRRSSRSKTRQRALRLARLPPCRFPVTLRHSIRASVFFGSFVASSAAPVSDLVDRRVVDVVLVGEDTSAATHGFDGREVSRGSLHGQTFRQTRAWMHLSLKTFDDTRVTVAYACIGADTLGRAAPLQFELVVEDSVLATPTLALALGESATTEVSVPFSLTRGKTSIAVLIRARGGRSPAVRELRTIQDHHELYLASTPPLGAPR